MKRSLPLGRCAAQGDLPQSFRHRCVPPGERRVDQRMDVVTVESGKVTRDVWIIEDACLRRKPPVEGGSPLSR